MSPSPDRRAPGFTLLEVMLAVVILGIILTTVYGSLSRTLSSKRVAEERAELFADGRDTVLRIANDLEGALPPPSGDRIYFRGSGGSGQVPTLEFVAMNRGSYGPSQARPGRVLIVYTLDPIPNQHGLYALRREEHLFAALLAEADGVAPPASDEENQAPTAVATYLLDCETMPDEIQLPGSCSRLTGLTFRYYDEASGSWTEQWDTTEDVNDARLPSAVEITLYLADEKGVEHDFSTIVDLPLARGQPTPRPGTDEDVETQQGFAGAGSSR